MSLPSAFAILVILAIGAGQINGLNPRKLDESTIPVGGEKCGGCSACNNPCLQSPPPPPPPSLPPPPPPPPSPKKPPTPGNLCPPPPAALTPPAYIYINGPPGDLYPVDQYYSGTSPGFARGPLLSAICGLLIGLLAYC